MRTLIVNECFVVPNIYGLVCILQNSPLTDELNLLLLEIYTLSISSTVYIDHIMILMNPFYTLGV
jgi:hypothetical protein